MGHWLNKAIEWMGALVNEAIGWMSHRVNGVIKWMRALVNESLGKWGHCYIWKHSIRSIVLIQAANRQSPAPQICSSHFLTHVSWGAGMLHATVTSSFFVCWTAHGEWGHWLNESLVNGVIKWMRASVTESLGEWVIEWMGHWVNESLGEWIIESMKALVKEAIG